MPNKLCAIDLGFLYTKAIIDGKQMILKSVVGDGKTLNFSDLDMGLNMTKDRFTSRLGKEQFFVSDLAMDQSDTILHSLKPDRFDSKAAQVIVNTVFGLGLVSGNHFGFVVSGLPVSHYAKFKNEIKVLFQGDRYLTHEFDVTNGITNLQGSIRILDGRFIPQPFGALMHQVLDKDGNICDKDLATRTVAVIDPGFGTTDVYVTDALSPVEKLTFSTETAMNHSYRLIANKIEENFGVSLPLYAIEPIVLKKQFRANGRSYDMTSLIDWAYSSTANQLVTEITNKWKNIHQIDFILIAGGGGANLAPYILPEFSNAILIPDAQWSIVRGYEKWGRRAWKGEL